MRHNCKKDIINLMLFFAFNFFKMTLNDFVYIYISLLVFMWYFILILIAKELLFVIVKIFRKYSKAPIKIFFKLAKV